ncbi:branched-chain amino acid ABC transporter permease [Streptomyces sp. NPDC005728]|uniref:branched-chain amino acid ABC transporter permease n=1 Tax=Streptomyces sp. NPDC005728 TaxID=3157054 RepID=UPI0033DFF4E0
MSSSTPSPEGPGGDNTGATPSTGKRRTRIPRPPARTAKLIALIAILFAVAVHGPGEVMTVATTAAIFGIAGIGLTVLAGPTRIVNLGSSCFIGVGAFTTAYVNNVYAPNFLISLSAAAAVCLVLGWAVAPIASRLAGVYIAVITVGLAFLGQHVFRIADGWTGGTVGVLLTDIPFFGANLAGPAQFGNLVIERSLAYFLLCSVVLALCVIASTRLLDSRIGRALHVVGTSSITARSFGINPARYRGTALVFSAVLCGLAGGLLAGQQSFVSWEQFDMLMSVDLIAVIVLGGMGSVYGAVIGAAVLYSLPQIVEALAPYLPYVTVGPSGNGLSPEQFTAVVYGAALVVVMVLEPRGLATLASRIAERIRTRAVLIRKETNR